ncbi:hypothetical protein BCR34DRAFT_208705 [Clohesyomyces aquaticus]|uniref:Uncharacterized protein n=1 Tax=Clohesyomyces aquaticus TaxID=1231657 RepID=A0A1Y2A9M7_9PLEO|nr:hypothetical protein BCR34DRAFT_208705 [Clohesyomyces aquaticus]
MTMLSGIRPGYGQSCLRSNPNWRIASNHTMSLRISTIYKLLTLVLLHQIVTATSSCGSLITYRQYSTVLGEDGPRCFRGGCGDEFLESLSSKCIKTSSCYELYSTISNHTGLDNCRVCRGDIACRTHGWPIVNATGLCQSIPQDWMLLDQDCCGSPEDTKEIALWIKEICSDEWRHHFGYFGGMAKDDWQEWILPWNWTITANNATTDGKKILPCHSPSYYLFYFAMESFVTLLSVFILPKMKTKWHYAHDRQKWGAPHHGPGLDISDWIRQFVLGFKNGLYWMPRKIRDVFQWIIRVWERRTGRRFRTRKWGFGRFARAVVMAFIMVIIEIGTTFFNAWLLRTAPGLRDFDWVRLGFLWCSRPSLAWLASVYGIYRSGSRTIFRFNLEDPWQVEMYTDSAYSSLLNEFIVQLLGSAYLGHTLRIGSQKGFYRPNHLSPYYRGPHAMQMYIGALFWCMTLPFALIGWGIVAFRYALLVGLRDIIHGFMELIPWTMGRLKDWYRLRVGIPMRNLRDRWAQYRQKRRSNRRWRPPNLVQRLFNRYIIRGAFRRWLDRHIQGTPRKFIEYLLRRKLRDRPTRKPSRTQTIHYNQPGGGDDASNSLLELRHPLPEMSTAQPLDSIWNGTIFTSAPRSGDPLASSQDIVAASPYRTMPTDFEEEQFLPAMRVSSVRPGFESGGGTTSDRMDARPLSSMQRRTFNRVSENTGSAYETVQLDDIPAPGSYAQGFRPQYNPNPFGDENTILPECGLSDPFLDIHATEILGRQENIHGARELPAASPHTDVDQPDAFESYLDWAIKQYENEHDTARRLHEEWNEEHYRRLWMTLIMSTGGLLCISQWLFWDGFVKASGERSVPFKSC